MKLYLMQHGDAVAEEINPDRPLSDAGRQDVERLAALLRQAPFRPELILHSGKTRARQSAELLAQGTRPGVCVEAAAGLKPNDPVQPLADQANRWTEDTLLVGHQPFMGRLVALLLGGEGRAMAALQPGSLVCLERQPEGGWLLDWMIRPDLLGGR